MTGTVLQVYQDKTGRLYFRTDISSRLSEEERRMLVYRLESSMRAENGNGLGRAVSSCIRQLALGAALCFEDAAEFKRRFREEVSGL